MPIILQNQSKSQTKSQTTWFRNSYCTPCTCRIYVMRNVFILQYLLYIFKVGMMSKNIFFKITVSPNIDVGGTANHLIIMTRPTVISLSYCLELAYVLYIFKIEMMSKNIFFKISVTPKIDVGGTANHLIIMPRPTLISLSYWLDANSAPIHNLHHCWYHLLLKLP